MQDVRLLTLLCLQVCNGFPLPPLRIAPQQTGNSHQINVICILYIQIPMAYSTDKLIGCAKYMSICIYNAQNPRHP